MKPKDLNVKPLYIEKKSSDFVFGRKAIKKVSFVRIPLSEWVSIKHKEPPKDRPFLAKWEYGFTVLEWRKLKDHDSYEYMSFNEHCNCCSGYCTVDFDEWLEIPK